MNKFDCVLIVVLIGGLILFALPISFKTQPEYVITPYEETELIYYFDESESNFSGVNITIDSIFNKDYPPLNRYGNCTIEHGKQYIILINNEYNIISCVELNI